MLSFVKFLLPPIQIAIHMRWAIVILIWALPLTSLAYANNTDNILKLSQADLQQNPTLLANFILQAIAQNRIDDVKSLNGLLTNDEVISNNAISPFVYHYSLGYVAMHDGKYKTAILHFNTLLKQQPHHQQIHLLLIKALALDKQYKHATQIIDDLLADTTLHPAIQQSLLQDKLWLQDKQSWQWTAQGNFLYSDNINQSPTRRQHQNWQLDTPIRAYGMHTALSANKTINLHRNLFIQSQLSLDGKHYNKHQFDDTQAMLGLGLLWQDSQTATSVLPFYQKRWYGMQAYSQNFGLQISHQYRLYPNTLANIAISTSQIHHQKRIFLDGNAHNLSVGIQRPNYWASLHHHQKNSKDPSESYQENGLSFGFRQSWQDWQASHHLAIHQRHYAGVDIFNIQRQDLHYQMQHRLWHNKLNYHGYQPSLNLQYTRTNSNHFAFDGKNTRLFLQINKNF